MTKMPKIKSGINSYYILGILDHFRHFDFFTEVAHETIYVFNP
jgi:hypothetical protein